jgi:hypothetical protein
LICNLTAKAERFTQSAQVPNLFNKVFSLRFLVLSSKEAKKVQRGKTLVFRSKYYRSRWLQPAFTMIKNLICNLTAKAERFTQSAQSTKSVLQSFSLRFLVVK